MKYRIYGSYRQHQLQYLVPIVRLYSFLFLVPISVMPVDKDFRPHQLKTAAALNVAQFVFVRQERNYLHLLLGAGNPYGKIILLVSENSLEIKHPRKTKLNIYK